MIDAIKLAQKKHREMIESLYEGMATVTEHRKVTDPETKLTSYREEVVLKDQPCRLSFEKIEAAEQGNPAVGTGQTIKLFISPNIVIRPGSKIAVAQHGVTEDYTYSGKPAVHATHQEITLRLFERWA